MGFEDLPLELVLMICTELFESLNNTCLASRWKGSNASKGQQIRDLFRSLRLVNKAFSDASAKYSFSGITLDLAQPWGSAKGKAFQSISQSFLSTHVQQLYIQSADGRSKNASSTMKSAEYWEKTLQKLSNVRHVTVDATKSTPSLFWRLMDLADIFPLLDGIELNGSQWHLLAFEGPRFPQLSYGMKILIRSKLKSSILDLKHLALPASSLYSQRTLEIVAAQENLRSIRLGSKFDGSWCVDARTVSVNTSSLVEMTLINLSLDASQMVDWIMRNSRTLKRIHLEDIALDSGTWDGIFRSILTCIALLSVEFGMLSYDLVGAGTLHRDAHRDYCFHNRLAHRDVRENLKSGLKSVRPSDHRALRILELKPYWCEEHSTCRSDPSIINSKRQCMDEGIL